MSPAPSACKAGGIRHKLATTTNSNRLRGLKPLWRFRTNSRSFLFIFVNLARLLPRFPQEGDRRRPVRPGTFQPIAGRLLSKAYLFVALATTSDRLAPARRSS